MWHTSIIIILAGKVNSGRCWWMSHFKIWSEEDGGRFVCFKLQLVLEEMPARSSGENSDIISLSNQPEIISLHTSAGLESLGGLRVWSAFQRWSSKKKRQDSAETTASEEAWNFSLLFYVLVTRTSRENESTTSRAWVSRISRISRISRTESLRSVHPPLTCSAQENLHKSFTFQTPTMCRCVNKHFKPSEKV